MNIKSYIKNIITKKKNVKKNQIFLQENISNLTYFAIALSGKKITLLESQDEIGGYFKNKILLPNKISISENNKINLLAYHYKIIFSIESEKLDFYLPNETYNLDYLLLTSLLTIKTLHRIIFNLYPKIKNNLNIIYKYINKKRQLNENNKNKAFLLEILFKKLTYDKIIYNLKLNKNEISWLYEAENVHIYNIHDLEKKTNTLYKKLCDLYTKNGEIILNQIWGYLYYKTKDIKNTIEQKKPNIINKITKETKKTINKIAKSIELKKKNDDFSHLSLIFDYKKTIDEYKTGNKKIDDSENTDIDNNLNILDELNINKTIISNNKTTSSYNANILNKETIYSTYENNTIKNNYVYKEWNTQKNKYNNDWCNIYLEDINKTTKTNKENVNKIIEKYKIDIIKLRKNIKNILNIKIWKNRQIIGQDIDIDTLIDNYQDSKKNFFERLYKYKEKKVNDLAISILIDISLSTDSYLDNIKIINRIRELSLFIGESINKIINKYSLSGFYSNTRHDCRYVNIKNFTDCWDKKKYDIDKIIPIGYTRIGPAIRHTITNIKSINAKKKAIIIITDGKPTDYDEYEGKYGIEDIKKTIIEANKIKINIKSLLINDIPKPHFSSMFGIKNYKISKDIKKNKAILKTLQEIINEK